MATTFYSVATLCAMALPKIQANSSNLEQDHIKDIDGGEESDENKIVTMRAIL